MLLLALLENKVEPYLSTDGSCLLDFNNFGAYRLLTIMQVGTTSCLRVLLQAQGTRA
jgi:hypothetical protein